MIEENYRIFEYVNTEVSSLLPIFEGTYIKSSSFFAKNNICKILGKEKWRVKKRGIYYRDALCMCMTRYMLEEVPKIVH